MELVATSNVRVRAIAVTAPSSKAWHMQIRLLTLALVGAVVGWLWLANPLSKSALLQPQLDNVEPVFFDIPADLGAALTKFDAMGARLVSVEVADHCLFHSFAKPKQVHILADASWRKGVICLVTDQGKVKEVYWLFQLSAP